MQIVNVEETDVEKKKVKLSRAHNPSAVLKQNMWQRHKCERLQETTRRQKDVLCCRVDNGAGWANKGAVLNV